MKKTVEFLGKKVIIRNEREASLIRILQNRIDDIVGYYNDNAFSENTIAFCSNLAREISHQVSCLYFMDMIDEPMPIFLEDILELHTHNTVNKLY